MSALIVNFFGGPGAGKSTAASGAFHALKKQGDINVEFVHEFAKELTWENRHGTLSNQTLILGQQFEMMRRCMDQVDVIITDTSLLNSAIYCHKYSLPYAAAIQDLAIAIYNSMNNMTFLVERVKDYNPVGRYQDEIGAKQVDTDVRKALDQFTIGYVAIPGSTEGVRAVVGEINNWWKMKPMESIR